MPKPKTTFTCKSVVWIYPGMAGWHFVNLDKKTSKYIQEVFGALKRGWGSLPVRITIGKTSWDSSIFPDKKSGTYLLPLKADVRKKEHIEKDQRISYTIEIRV